MGNSMKDLIGKVALTGGPRLHEQNIIKDPRHRKDVIARARRRR
jgi:hypothetical protein